MKDRTNRNLGIGFLLGIALCAACCAIDITMILFALVVPFFCAQLLLLRVTKKWPLRLLPAYPIAALLLAAGYFALFGKGWDGLAALIFSLLAIAPAVGCGLAVIVHRFSGTLRAGKWLIVILSLLGWGGAWLGQEVSLGYWDRAFIKTLSFLGCLELYLLLSGDRDFWNIFKKPDRASLKLSAILGIGVFLFLTVGYMILSPWLDLSAIPEQLRLNDITPDNFLLVAAFITVCNSFLEELFFRGFAFLTLRRHASPRFAYLFSGLVFALYHVSIMSGWFHPVWFVLFIAGLAVGGMLFDFLDRKGSIWCGWFVHAGANLAINLIGMRMFGMI